MQNPNYKEIGSFEDACKAKGIDADKFLSDLVAIGAEAHKVAQAKLELFASTVNGDWKASYKDRNQQKWFPYFWYGPNGFVLHYVNYRYVYTAVSPRLCFETAEQAGRTGATWTIEVEVKTVS